MIFVQLVYQMLSLILILSNILFCSVAFVSPFDEALISTRGAFDFDLTIVVFLSTSGKFSVE
jgi:hypothetical protein